MSRSRRRPPGPPVGSEFASAALDGAVLGDLAPEEAEMFAKMRERAPVFQELVDEGTVTPSGEPRAGSFPTGTIMTP